MSSSSGLLSNRYADLFSDTAEWTELHRAAQLASAAYTGCIGTAFDVTITKQLNDLVTDTQVGIAS